MYFVVRLGRRRDNSEAVLLPARDAMFKSLGPAEDFALQVSREAAEGQDLNGPIQGACLVVQVRSRVAPWKEVGDFTVPEDSDEILNHSGVQARLMNLSGSARSAFFQGKKVKYDFARWRNSKEFVLWKKPEESPEETPRKVIPDVDPKDQVIRNEVPKEVKVQREKPAALDALGAVGDALKDYVDGGDAIIAKKIMQLDRQGGQQIDLERLKETFRKEIEKQVEDLSPKVTEVKIPDRKVQEVEGCFHEKFDDLLQRSKMLPNVFLYGPSGSGKTHAAAQLAEALDLPYYTISCSAGMSEGHLLGRLLPTGENGKFEFTPSDFLRAYENGGVFLLDEVDAADPNVMIVINDAISGGRISVPNRPEKPHAIRHEDFVLVAAGNTLGNGRDRMYVGRNQLDQATLRRFKFGMIEWPYSKRVEKALCPDSSLRMLWEKMRKAAESNQIRRVIDTQSLQQAYLFKTNLGWSDDQCVAQLQIDWTEDERRAVNR